MDALGKLIRQTMVSKKLSTTDLSNIIGLHPKTIDNVIYGRSKKLSLINKISKGLGVDLLKNYPIENLNIDVKNADETLNLEAHSRATNVVASSLKDNKIICTKKQLDTLVTTLYNFMLDHPNRENSSWEDFTEGMIRFGMKCFYFRNNNINNDDNSSK